MARSEFRLTEEFPAVEWRDACRDRDFGIAWSTDVARPVYVGAWPDDAREHVVRRVREHAQRYAVAHLTVERADEIPGAVRDEFEELADVWRRETRGAPFLITRVTHWAYQRIVGMGPQVLPLILRALERETDHWFWALNAISGEDPAQGVEGFEDASVRWLEWGRDNRLLT